MTLHHDVKKGWVEHQGEPHWRTTQAALKRLEGAEIAWTGIVARAYVAHLASGKPVGTIRCHPQHKRYSVRIEGFQFWSYNRILQKEHFMDVQGFDTLREARAFMRRVLLQAGAATVARS